MTPNDKSAYTPPHPNYYTGYGDVAVTRANLPHWSKAQTTTFVTFRLADSLPQEKLLRLQQERADWIASHPQPWDDETQQAFRSIFYGPVQKWLDAGFGCCLLRDPRSQRIVEDTLWHFADTRYALYAYVIMPNHVHVLLMPTSDHNITDIISSIKRFSARHINEVFGREGPLWQKESFDTLVRSEQHFQTIVRYIRQNNPKRAWSAYQ